MKEPLPLATVHEAILDFCRGRKDVCVFGAQALNRYADEPRMTQDVDLMANDPAAVANELAGYLAARFPSGMAARVRAVSRKGAVLGYRVYQSRSAELGGNRHLADIRRFDVPRDRLAETDGVQYTGPELTVAMKAAAAVARTNEAKRLQDQADLARLIVALPEIEADELAPLWQALGSPPGARAVFEDIKGRKLEPETDEDSFY